MIDIPAKIYLPAAALLIGVTWATAYAMIPSGPAGPAPVHHAASPVEAEREWYKWAGNIEACTTKGIEAIDRNQDLVPSERKQGYKDNVANCWAKFPRSAMSPEARAFGQEKPK
jgi:hypothetical protein